MCDSCGCGDTNLVPLDVQQRILSDNERTAKHNRHHFNERALLAINVMGWSAHFTTASGLASPLDPPFSPDSSLLSIQCHRL